MEDIGWLLELGTLRGVHFLDGVSLNVTAEDKTHVSRQEKVEKRGCIRFPQMTGSLIFHRTHWSFGCFCSIFSDRHSLGLRERNKTVLFHRQSSKSRKCTIHLLCTYSVDWSASARRTDWASGCGTRRPCSLHPFILEDAPQCSRVWGERHCLHWTCHKSTDSDNIQYQIVWDLLTNMTFSWCDGLSLCFVSLTGYCYDYYWFYTNQIMVKRETNMAFLVSLNHCHWPVVAPAFWRLFMTDTRWGC